jgi:hypothetical protein
MISLTSTAVLESQVLPGAKIHCKRFGVARRQAVDIKLAEHRERLRPLAQEVAENWPIFEERNDKGEVVMKGDSPEVMTEKFKRRLVVQPQYEALEAAYIKPVYIETYVDHIEGVELDGRPMLPSEMPDELADEAFKFIKERGGLTPGEKTGSGSATTSKPPEPTATPDSTAPTVVNPAP